MVCRRWVRDLVESDLVHRIEQYISSLGRYAAHAGSKLTPPLGDEARMRELGPLLPTDVRVRGDGFRISGTDVAIAGLGWIAVAVDGATDLRWVCAPLYWHIR